MADFNRDRDETINHPKIIEFLNLCDSTCGEGCITAQMIKESSFINYWPHLIVLEWEEEKRDFRYKMWGSQLTRFYGLELTGKYIADGDHKDAENPFIEAHYEAMSERKRIFLGGTIDWRDKPSQTWNQVIMPLERNGKIGETLTYVTFT